MFYCRGSLVWNTNHVLQQGITGTKLDQFWSLSDHTMQAYKSAIVNDNFDKFVNFDSSYTIEYVLSFSILAYQYEINFMCFSTKAHTSKFGWQKSCVVEREIFVG